MPNSSWLAAAHSISSDNDLRSGRLNNSSDDLRADAAATRPSPASPLEGRGQAIKAKEPEVGPRVALTVSSAEKPSSAAGGCARAHPPERNVTEKDRSLCKKVRQSLQASTNTPFEARGLLSGTIIRGTPKTPNLDW
jgi:hypothetical protein